MSANTRFWDSIGVRYPIVQAPMAGATTPELVAAVSNAGGLGMLPGAYLTPGQISNGIAATRHMTARPFGVNLFALPDPAPSEIDPSPMLALLASIHSLLGIDPPTVPTDSHIPFASQLEAVLEADVPILSFTMGIPEPGAFARLRHHGTVIIGTATTVREARLLEDAGVDAIVAQGAEAGAHRGTFDSTVFSGSGMIGTLALVPQVVDAVGVPVIASGGIMDGRGIVAAEALGAVGVQMGTAFLMCSEAGLADAYRQALRDAGDDSTAITRAFSGRAARGIVNEFMQVVDPQEHMVLPFPLQNSLTRQMRSQAMTLGEARFMSLWAGQGVGLAREMTAPALIETLVTEMDEVRERLGTPVRSAT